MNEQTQNNKNDRLNKNPGKSVPDSKTGSGNNGSSNEQSETDDMATSSQQQFGSDRPLPDERSNRDRTGKYDEADPLWVNPDVQMNNEENNRDVSNSLVDSQTKAP
jgi:hypothetical protein